MSRKLDDSRFYNAELAKFSLISYHPAMKTKTMKKLLPFMTLAGIMTFAVAQSKEKIEKPIAEAIQSHLLEHGYLQPDRDHKDLDKVFKGAKLYRVWINSQMGDGVSSGSGLTILKQRDKISVFNQARNAVLSLIKSYDKKISNANELKAVMIAMTPVSEIKDMGDGVYHVYNGDDFFDVPSGFLVKLKDGKVDSCEYEMKLGEKKSAKK